MYPKKNNPQFCIEIPDGINIMSLCSMHYAKIPTPQASLLCPSFHAPGAYPPISPPKRFLQYSEKIHNATRSELSERSIRPPSTRYSISAPPVDYTEPTRLLLEQGCVDMLLTYCRSWASPLPFLEERTLSREVT